MADLTYQHTTLEEATPELLELFTEFKAKFPKRESTNPWLDDHHQKQVARRALVGMLALAVQDDPIYQTGLLNRMYEYFSQTLPPEKMAAAEEIAVAANDLCDTWELANGTE